MPRSLLPFSTFSQLSPGTSADDLFSGTIPASNPESNSGAIWRLELFGGFRAQRLRLLPDAAALPQPAIIERFRTQKTASLLAYLALRRGVVRREILCELFWPEARVESSRNSLRVALSGLRVLLEPPGVPEGAALQISRDAVELGAGVETDVAHFLRSLQQAQHSSTARERRPALEAVINLYRGPLLQGQTCEWLTNEEARFEDFFVAAFSTLIADLEAESLETEAPQADGQLLRALDLGRAAIAAAPTREEPLRVVLRLGLQLGQATQSARDWVLWQKHAGRAGVSVGPDVLELAREVQKASASPSSNPAADSAPQAPTQVPTQVSVESTAESTSEPTVTPQEESRGRSLPMQWTTFFGRQHDLETLQNWLSQPSTQLVTITGTGGGGKTRLALEIARSLAFAPSIPAKSPAAPPLFRWVEWISLADLSLATFLPGAILDALRLPRGDSSLVTLIEALRQIVEQQAERQYASGTRLLLILDNFEHLGREGASFVHDLLAAVPELVCLITSQSRLGFEGEREWPLQPLPTPEFESDLTEVARTQPAPLAPATALADGFSISASSLPTIPLAVPLATSFSKAQLETLASSASVQLFLDRAKLARPGFTLDASNLEVVARLCAYLDGLPLAIELAAARVMLFSPAQILAGVNFQRQHPPITHQNDAELAAQPPQPAPLDWVNTNRAAPPRHQSLRATIAWSHQQLPRSAAQFWSHLSVFRGGWTLEAAAFVCEERDAPPLVLSLRDISLILLDVRAETPRGRQLEVLREYASEALTAAQQQHLSARHARYFLHWAETIKPHLDGPRVAHYLRLLETDRENLRAAYLWLLDNDIEGALRLGIALYWSWELRGRVEEGRGALTYSLALAKTAFPELKAAFASSEANEAGNEITPSEIAHDEVARRRLQLVTGAQIGAGKLATVASDIAAARPHLEAALRGCRALGNEMGAADCLYSLGYMHLKSGSLDEARVLCDESVAIYRRSDNNTLLCDALYNRALVALYEGDFATVRVLNNERLAIHRGAGERRGVAISLEILGLAALLGDEFEAAHAYFSEALLIFEAISETLGVTRILWGLGHVARSAGERELARQTFFRSLRLARDSQTPWTLPYLFESLVYLLTDGVREEADEASGEATGNTFQTLDAIAAARGVRLLGAAARLREMHREPLPHLVFRRILEASIATLRAALSPAHFDSEWQLGHTLSSEAMISLALEEAP